MLCGHRIITRPDYSTAKDFNNHPPWIPKHYLEKQHNATKFRCLTSGVWSLNTKESQRPKQANPWNVPRMKAGEERKGTDKYGSRLADSVPLKHPVLM